MKRITCERNCATDDDHKNISQGDALFIFVPAAAQIATNLVDSCCQQYPFRTAESVSVILNATHFTSQPIMKQAANI